MVLWPLPCEFCRVWASTSQVINEISVKFAWVFQYIYSFRRQFRRQFSTVFDVILQVPSAGTTVRFDRVFQKLIMWCTETTLFPHRQSAENAGRHWNSTEEVPSPHSTCVTEQLELTRQVARIERVIINTTSIQTSILNCLPRNFAGAFGWYYGDCPVNYVKFERILQKLLMRLVWNLIEYFKSYLFRRQFRRQFSTVFHVVLQAPSNGIMATALWIL